MVIYTFHDSLGMPQHSINLSAHSFPAVTDNNTFIAEVYYLCRRWQLLEIDLLIFYLHLNIYRSF